MDVKIVYDGRGTPAEESAAAIATTKLDPSLLIKRSKSSGIAHNKFILLVRKGTPVAVWTGSTNMTESGIYGQSNVAHVVRDPAVAAKYLEYWTQLAADTPTASLRKWTVGATPEPQRGGVGHEASAKIVPIFSPRTGDGMLKFYKVWMFFVVFVLCVCVCVCVCVCLFVCSFVSRGKNNLDDGDERR